MAKIICSVKLNEGKWGLLFPKKTYFWSFSYVGGNLNFLCSHFLIVVVSDCETVSATSCDLFLFHFFTSTNIQIYVDSVKNIWSYFCERSFVSFIVKRDSMIWSFCLRHYVQNGLSYLGKETLPTLCLKGRQSRFGISSLGTNKDQLLHRIPKVACLSGTSVLVFVTMVSNGKYNNHTLLNVGKNIIKEMKRKHFVYINFAIIKLFITTKRSQEKRSLRN